MNKLKVLIMLYSKEKTGFKRRSYEHLHTHTSKEQMHRLKSVGRVMLNGTPKK
ncbi:hypothetical protein [Yeosuana marina]|uniref:hypothetical protein n=1 Tax=Yeosuana marina TaxID=1565536 RepID=UPI001422D765|nr:hypothetical protein [Yeosuana marina]|tara:strand:+ start:8395 stop:8553 length:159 start_codon:yes stop_codon:yes gene_type:complete